MAAGYLGASAAINQFNKSLTNAKEIENLSRLANQSAEEFQAAAYAVEQYGISAEKMADMSQDAIRKLGDYMATGGGEFADFFENVAPQVGLTAQELQNLAGPDVLIAVKKAMDDANISMEEQRNYLDAIASDADALIPILEDNGKAYRELTKEANELNIVMSQQDIDALIESGKTLNKVGQQISVSFARGVAGASEQIEWFGDVLSTAVEYWGTFLDSLNDMPNTIEGTIEKIVDTQEEIDSLNASIERLEKNKNAYNRDAQLAAARANVARLEQELKGLQEHRWGLQADLTIPEQPKIKPITPVDPVGKTAEEAADKIIQENQRVWDSLQAVWQPSRN